MLDEETYLERKIIVAGVNKEYFKMLLLKIKLWILRRKK
jgi:hypothetical protein